MAKKIASLLIDIATNVARVQQDFSKIEGRMKKFERTAGTIMKGVAGAITVALGVKGVNALNTFVKSGVRTIDRMQDMAQAAGLNIEKWQGLAQAAKYAGVEEQKVAAAIRRLNMNLIDSNSQLRESQRYFTALKIAWKDSKGFMRDTGDVLYDVADALQKYKIGSRQAGLAAKILGRSGAELIPVCRGGSKSIEEAIQRLKQFGALITEETARKMDLVNRNITDMERALEGVKLQIMTGMADSLKQLSDGLLQCIQSGQGFELIGKGLGKSLVWLSKIAIIAAHEIELVASAMRLLKRGGPSLEEFSLQMTDIANRMDAALWQLRRPVKIAKPETEAFKKGVSDIIDEWETARKKISGGKKKDLISDTIKALEEEAYLLNKTALEQSQYNAIKKAGIEISYETGEAYSKIHQIIIDNISAMVAENEQIKAKVEAEQEMIDKAEAVKDSIKDQTEIYKEQKAEIETLRAMELLTEEEYEKAISKVNNELDEYLKKLEEIEKQHEDIKKLNVWEHMAKGTQTYFDSIKSFAEGMEDVTTNAFHSMEDELTKFITGGKASFKDFVDSVLADIARLVIQQQITRPLAGMMIGALPGFGVSPAPIPAPPPGAIMAHEGGIIGIDDIPKYHDGLATDEELAVLQKGELVIPKDITAALQKDMSVGLRGYNKEALSMASQAEDSVRAHTLGMGQAVEDFTRGAKADFTGLVDSINHDFERITMDKDLNLSLGVSGGEDYSGIGGGGPYPGGGGRIPIEMENSGASMPPLGEIVGAINPADFVVGILGGVTETLSSLITPIHESLNNLFGIGGPSDYVPYETKINEQIYEIIKTYEEAYNKIDTTDMQKANQELLDITEQTRQQIKEIIEQTTSDYNEIKEAMDESSYWKTDLELKVEADSVKEAQEKALETYNALLDKIKGLEESLKTLDNDVVDGLPSANEGMVDLPNADDMQSISETELKKLDDNLVAAEMSVNDFLDQANSITENIIDTLGQHTIPDEQLTILDTNIKNMDIELQKLLEILGLFGGDVSKMDIGSLQDVSYSLVQAALKTEKSLEDIIAQVEDNYKSVQEEYFNTNALVPKLKLKTELNKLGDIQKILTNLFDSFTQSRVDMQELIAKALHDYENIPLKTDTSKALEIAGSMDAIDISINDYMSQLIDLTNTLTGKIEDTKTLEARSNVDELYNNIAKAKEEYEQFLQMSDAFQTDYETTDFSGVQQAGYELIESALMTEESLKKIVAQTAADYEKISNDYYNTSKLVDKLKLKSKMTSQEKIKNLAEETLNTVISNREALEEIFSGMLHDYENWKLPLEDDINLIEARTMQKLAEAISEQAPTINTEEITKAIENINDAVNTQIEQIVDQTNEVASNITQPTYSTDPIMISYDEAVQKAHDAVQAAKEEYEIFLSKMSMGYTGFPSPAQKAEKTALQSNLSAAQSRYTDIQEAGSMENILPQDIEWLTMHSGGMVGGHRLRGDEYPTILQEGEMVTPRDEVGESGLTISVPVTIAERNPGLARELRKEIEDTVLNIMRRHA